MDPKVRKHVIACEAIRGYRAEIDEDGKITRHCFACGERVPEGDQKI